MNFHVKYKIGSSMHNLGNIGVVFSLSVKRSGIYMAVLLRPRRMKNCCLLLRRPADRPKGGSPLLLSSPLPERHTSPLTHISPFFTYSLTFLFQQTKLQLCNILKF